MTPSLILYLLVVGALVTMSAFALDIAFRRAALPTRWVWVGALGAMLVFAFAAPRRAPAHPTLSLATQVQYVESDVPLTPTNKFALAFLRGQQWADAALTSAFVTLDSRIPAGVSVASGFVWATASALVLLLLVSVHRRVDRARRGWPAMELHGALVRLAPRTGPAVIGVTRPEIVLPQWLMEREAHEQRLVVVHEREHVTSRDHLLPIWAWLVAAALPWHPAVWWMMSRLRLAIELDCDARVLKRGVQPREYGFLLIDIAGQCAGHRMGALALADKTSHLERRLHAMNKTRPSLGVVRTVGLCAIAGLSLVAACEARLPTSAEITTMDVSAAEKAANGILLPTQAGYAYVIDGKSATESDARALAGSRIASVSMEKPRGAGDDAKATVRITTVEYEAAKPPSYMVREDHVTSGRTALGTKMTLSDGKNSPLVVIDGVVADEAVLAKVRSASILSVEVLKGIAAKTAFTHPAAANGVIKITTKGGVSSRTEPVAEFRKTEMPPEMGVKITGTVGPKRTPFLGLVYVDGVRASASVMDTMSGVRIKSIDVLKGAAASAMSSDPAAANGIVRITTKPNE